jgi:hypothetical protein
MAHGRAQKGFMIAKPTTLEANAMIAINWDPFIALRQALVVQIPTKA